VARAIAVEVKGWAKSTPKENNWPRMDGCQFGPRIHGGDAERCPMDQNAWIRNGDARLSGGTYQRRFTSVAKRAAVSPAVRLGPVCRHWLYCCFRAAGWGVSDGEERESFLAYAILEIHKSLLNEGPITVALFAGGGLGYSRQSTGAELPYPSGEHITDIDYQGMGAVASLGLRLTICRLTGEVRMNLIKRNVPPSRSQNIGSCSRAIAGPMVEPAILAGIGYFTKCCYGPQIGS